MGNGDETSWRVVGASVRGASHVRADLPNQDAIGWRPDEACGPPIVLAVSDGHGSAKSFRSARGARLAVEAVLAECQHLLAEGAGTPYDFVRKQATQALAGHLVRRWRDAVQADLDGEPFTDAEWETLAKKDARGRERVEQNPHLAYGATLLAALVAENFILYVQLGDGDILAVSGGAEVSRPLPRDERLIANETTSLCSKNAADEVRVVVTPTGDGAPALILVSTDGYANSFRDEAGFTQVGADILDMLVDDGLDAVAKDMASWLDDASKVGSGDDITLGLLVRDAGLAARRAARGA